MTNLYSFIAGMLFVIFVMPLLSEFCSFLNTLHLWVANKLSNTLETKSNQIGFEKDN